MQSITINSVTPVHIKATINNEFRRFLLDPPTIVNLSNTLKSLCGFEDDVHFSFKFLDDEGDWITFSTDAELLYASQISEKFIKILVNLENATEEVKCEENCNESSLVETEEFPPFRGGRGKGWGRGRGRGRGRGKYTFEEKMEFKTSRLSQRIQQLENRIQNGKGDERVLLWRLKNLQAKLENMKAIQENGDRPFPGNNQGWRKRGGRGGRGRGRGPGRGRRNFFPDDDLHNETLSNDAQSSDVTVSTESSTPSVESENNDVTKADFKQCKQNLIAARKSGNKEEVQICLAAFKIAKEDYFASRPEKVKAVQEARAHLSECQNALKTARKAQNKEEVQVCLKAVQEAKNRMHAAKSNM